MEPKKNNGKEYEGFVAELQRLLLSSELYAKQKNITIEQNKLITNKCGIQREFDLYWEFEFGGITYKTVIECKDYNSRISIEKIDAFTGKLSDFSNITGIFATKLGYQSGAKTKAEHYGIELLVVRKQNEQDWQDKDGIPYIKKIEVNGKLQGTTEIINFAFQIDGNWAKENTDIDASKNPYSQVSARNDQIIIENLDTSKKYSLRDLATMLYMQKNGTAGTFEEEKKFNNAFIYVENKKWKLNSYKVKYVINKPTEFPICIDFEKELLGVIENLSKDRKTSLFKTGVAREEIGVKL